MGNTLILHNYTHDHITSSVTFLSFHTLCNPVRVSYIMHKDGSSLVYTIFKHGSFIYIKPLPKIYIYNCVVTNSKNIVPVTIVFQKLSLSTKEKHKIDTFL